MRLIWLYVRKYIHCSSFQPVFAVKKTDADLPKAKFENIKAYQMAMLLTEGAIWEPLCICVVFLIYYLYEPKE